ncbi:MAG: hypothetical protein GW875_13660 [Deltaproteobacteria bacterium]|nr:hypothetical protein [Deltaproteobacteria bacterium]NCP03292.1 hypothetical protein [Deltaproteobacteria bacterium]NCP78410.1 hypothetical protein [Desulfuromonadales bacterium]
MKNILILAILLLGATSVFAGTGPANIANTPHNLSYSGNLYQAPSYWYNATTTAEEEICVYCHTPHGGSLDAPLWNRDLTSLQGVGIFQHYASSTLSSTVGASNRAVNAESLTCLSCHDGSIGVGDSLLNNPITGVPTNSVVPVQGGFGVQGPRIGASNAATGSTGDLRDDHPVSFSYTAAYGDVTNAGDLQLDTDVEAAGLVLFGTGQNVECSTCHDPHVDYMTNVAYTPFLAIPNTGSAMCLACHIK